MKTIKCCNNPQYRNWENFCRNCGVDKKYEQFSKKSIDGVNFTWSVEVWARWYFISITDWDWEATHTFKQKEVRVLEDKTWLTGQELADLVASKTTSVRYNFNGKYGNSYISYDLRSEEEKEKDEKRVLEFKKQKEEEEKKEEEELQKIYTKYAWKKIEVNWWKRGFEIFNEIKEKIQEKEVYSTYASMLRCASFGNFNFQKAILIFPKTYNEIRLWWWRLNVDRINELVTIIR